MRRNVRSGLGIMWDLLVSELDRWDKAGAVATFWWRDDDAISDTKQLSELLDCADQAPVALAVIPKFVDKTLAKKLRRHPSVTVLQHGWTHANHRKDGVYSEYPAGRDKQEVEKEFLLGRKILSDLFGAQSLAVFVPPFHGFDDEYFHLLLKCGLNGFSSRRTQSHSVLPGLTVHNIHCQPMTWTAPPSFSSDDAYLTDILHHLEGRRCGQYDASRPTGILTHHLVQNQSTYEFMAKLSKLVSEHRAGRWADAREMFKRLS
jgi:hypothetical protein